MATREDLLVEFNRFDDDTLKKLITIADSIMSPLDTALTSADFASMVDEVFKANGLADRYFPAWTDRSKADFGRFLVEIFALFSDKDFMYLNHFSNEGFGARAELYRSLVHKAIHDGLPAPANISAKGNVELIFTSGADEFVPRGAIGIGSSALASAKYVNQEFTIPASAIDTPVTVEFLHGELRKEEGFFDGYSIRVPVENAAQKTIKLTIAGEDWTEVNDFLNATAASKVFMVVYDEFGRPEILFGVDDFGARPELDAVWSVELIQGGGYIGDILANTLDKVLTSETNRNLLSFTQFAIAGGNVQMPKEQLRQTIIAHKRHLERAVTPPDTVAILKELEFVKKAYAEVFQNYVYVYALPASGGALTASEITQIRTKLDPEKVLLMGYNLTVDSAIFVPIKMRVDIYINATTPKSGANTVATQTIREYLDPLLKGDFGKGVNRTQLSSLLYGRVKGAQNVVFNTLHRLNNVQAVNDITAIKQEMISYTGSDIVVNIIGGM